MRVRGIAMGLFMAYGLSIALPSVQIFNSTSAFAGKNKKKKSKRKKTNVLPWIGAAAVLAGVTKAWFDNKHNKELKKQQQLSDSHDGGSTSGGGGGTTGAGADPAPTTPDTTAKPATRGADGGAGATDQPAADPAKTDPGNPPSAQASAQKPPSDKITHDSSNFQVCFKEALQTAIYNNVPQPTNSSAEQRFRIYAKAFSSLGCATDEKETDLSKAYSKTHQIAAGDSCLESGDILLNSEANTSPVLSIKHGGKPYEVALDESGVSWTPVDENRTQNKNRACLKLKKPEELACINLTTQSCPQTVKDQLVASKKTDGELAPETPTPSAGAGATADAGGGSTGATSGGHAKPASSGNDTVVLPAAPPPLEPVSQ